MFLSLLFTHQHARAHENGNRIKIERNDQGQITHMRLPDLYDLCFDWTQEQVPVQLLLNEDHNEQNYTLDQAALKVLTDRYLEINQLPSVFTLMDQIENMSDRIDVAKKIWYITYIVTLREKQATALPTMEKQNQLAQVAFYNLFGFNFDQLPTDTSQFDALLAKIYAETRKLEQEKIQARANNHRTTLIALKNVSKNILDQSNWQILHTYLQEHHLDAVASGLTTLVATGDIVFNKEESDIIRPYINNATAIEVSSITSNITFHVDPLTKVMMLPLSFFRPGFLDLESSFAPVDNAYWGGQYFESQSILFDGHDPIVQHAFPIVHEYAHILQSDMNINADLSMSYDLMPFIVASAHLFKRHPAFFDALGSDFHAPMKNMVESSATFYAMIQMAEIL
ncbi:MAG: hypothetical protein KDK51_04815 [Deltaproteobacteria bacterium]|nr:hypothetical protein [Deltaproteobacteria bacterium]